MSHNETQAKKLKAAMMLSQGMKQSEVAQELGIAVRTLQRWQKEPDFKKSKSDVALSVVTTIKETSENIVQSCQPIFSYQDKIRLISEEYERLQIATNVCMNKLEQDNDLRACTILVKLSERKSKLLNLDIPPNDVSDALMTLSALGVLPDKVFDKVDDAITEMTDKLSEISASLYVD